MYYFQPQVDCVVTIATCNSARFVDDFDTMLYVLANATSSTPEVVACNDDACSFLSQLQVSSFIMIKVKRALKVCCVWLCLTSHRRSWHQSIRLHVLLLEQAAKKASHQQRNDLCTASYGLRLMLRSSHAQRHDCLSCVATQSSSESACSTATATAVMSGALNHISMHR